MNIPNPADEVSASVAPARELVGFGTRETPMTSNARPIDDGGLAFPQTPVIHQGEVVFGGHFDAVAGMSLRDYAAVRMYAVRIKAWSEAANHDLAHRGKVTAEDVEEARRLMARQAYLDADALLAARKGGAQ
jgi:hypothetical protein